MDEQEQSRAERVLCACPSTGATNMDMGIGSEGRSPPSSPRWVEFESRSGRLSGHALRQGVRQALLLGNFRRRCKHDYVHGLLGQSSVVLY